jgi:hypothetical protein
VIAKPAMNGAIKAATPKTSRTTASIVNRGDFAVDGIDGSYGACSRVAAP